MTGTEEHDVRVNGRKRVEVTGVASVESFDASAFTLTTNAGPLQIQGTSLHMKHLDLQAGVVIIEGTVNAVEYVQPKDRRRLHVGRLLK